MTEVSGHLSKSQGGLVLCSLAWRGAGFGVLLLFIAVVSVHDAVLVALHDTVIAQVEMNPLGCWLIELGGGQIWLFLAAKFAGTSVVCAVLVALYQQWRHAAMVIAPAIGAFQLGLLLYLSL